MVTDTSAGWPNKKKYRILDLDNVLADDSWRVKHINWAVKGQDRSIERYASYHLLCGFDEYRNAHFVELRDKGSEILVFTGRPVLVYPITHEWLRRHEIPVKVLFMRSADDNRPSVDVKRSMLEQAFQRFAIGPEDISIAVDDRPDICEMYREHGIHAKQVCIHALDAYRDGNS